MWSYTQLLSEWYGRIATNFWLLAPLKSPPPFRDHQLPDYQGFYSKGLTHDKNGVVNPVEFQKFYHAVIHGDMETLNGLHLKAKQVQPSVVMDRTQIGPYKQLFMINPPPSLSSAHGAQEMVELYWASLLRDVPFDEWDENRLVRAACREMKCDPQFLLRLPYPGWKDGGYVSQLLLLPYTYGFKTYDQEYTMFAPKDFATTAQEIVQIQNGEIAGELKYDLRSRLIRTLRDAATYVHKDVPVQPWVNAACVLYSLKIPPNALMRTLASETPFINQSISDLCGLLNEAARSALEAAWQYKFTYWKIRPEVFGLYIDQAVESKTNPLGIHKLVFESDALRRVRAKQKSAVLSQCYPEGCPSHPSFSSGHSTVAGACSIVLKAFFDGTKSLNSKSSTVNSEINKMASNIAVARNAAGIHYRSDAEIGLKLGEEVGIEVLKQAVYRYKYKTGWLVEKRNGQQIEIKNYW